MHLPFDSTTSSLDIYLEDSTIQTTDAKSVCVTLFAIAKYWSQPELLYLGKQVSQLMEIAQK
jgi:hypothetical protein